jgi:hypothetical protein
LRKRFFLDKPPPRGSHTRPTLFQPLLLSQTPDPYQYKAPVWQNDDSLLTGWRDTLRFANVLYFVYLFALASVADIRRPTKGFHSFSHLFLETPNLPIA